MLKKTLFINGIEKRVVVDPEAALASVLRNQMFLTGTKVGCGKGECGACTVILDGKVVKSCITKMKTVPDDAQIITIEGIGTKESLHPLQLAWLIHGAAQCGFCTPGFIVSAKALLNENVNPTREEVKSWFVKNANICRCNGYEPAVDAVMDAARLLRGEAAKEELWVKLKEETKRPEASLTDPSAIAKVTGTLDFGADLGLMLPEGTLHIKLVKAQASQGNIISIDTSEAEKIPGVYKVITYRDVPGTNRISGSAFSSGKGDGRERAILTDKKIMEPDAAVAMVIAYTPVIAEEAAKKVKVDLGEIPASISTTAPTDKECLLVEPDVGFAYLNEKGKLMIHSRSVGLQLHELAEAIGIPAEKLAIVKNPASCTSEYKFTPAMEGLLGIAALVTKQPVYLEL
jgi:aldehyde oxidoreductase